MSLLLPTSELVAIAWLTGAPLVPADAVSTLVPRDESVWAATGLIQVRCIGGSPNPDVPSYHPVMSIDCWAVDPHSSRPPWRKANQLAEIVKAAGFGGIDAVEPARRKVSMPGYYDALVSAYAFFEPRPITSDDARFAHYQFDAQFHYTPLVGAI